MRAHKSLVNCSTVYSFYRLLHFRTTSGSIWSIFINVMFFKENTNIMLQPYNKIYLYIAFQSLQQNASISSMYINMNANRTRAIYNMHIKSKNFCVYKWWTFLKNESNINIHKFVKSAAIWFWWKWYCI